jgi:hypothetical protein
MSDESIQIAGSTHPTPTRKLMLTRWKALQDFYNELDQVVACCCCRFVPNACPGSSG